MSDARTGRILATIQFEKQSRPQSLLIRLRHPEEKRIRSVMVDGQDWKDFDAGKEWVRIDNLARDRYSVVPTY